MWVRFKLSESQYLEYRRVKASAKGRRAAAWNCSWPMNTKFPHAGHIENALNQVDPRTGTLEVQARFPNPQNLVLPGQFGRVRFQTQERQGVILVPQRAVQQNQSIQSVYTVGAGQQDRSAAGEDRRARRRRLDHRAGLAARRSCRRGRLAVGAARVFPSGRSHTNRRRARRRS